MSVTRLVATLAALPVKPLLAQRSVLPELRLGDVEHHRTVNGRRTAGRPSPPTSEIGRSTRTLSPSRVKGVVADFDRHDGIARHTGRAGPCRRASSACLIRHRGSFRSMVFPSRQGNPLGFQRGGILKRDVQLR